MGEPVDAGVPICEVLFGLF